MTQHLFKHYYNGRIYELIKNGDHWYVVNIKTNEYVSAKLFDFFYRQYKIHLVPTASHSNVSHPDKTALIDWISGHMPDLYPKLKI